MNIKKIVLATLLMSFSVLSAQEKAKGYVYNDTNKNGKKESKEKGISNVLVSNGVDVVATDKNGTYELQVTNDSPIFVIKPSGYQFALDVFNLPKFY